MDRVYECGRLSVTPSVCWEDYFTEFRSTLPPFDALRNKLPNEIILGLMNVPLSGKELRILATACSIQELRVPDQPAIVDVRCIKARPALYDKGTIPASALQLLESAKFVKRRIMHEETVGNLKYRSSIWPREEPVAKDPNLKPGQHTLYTVRVYHPFSHKVGIRNTQPPRCSQEMVLLGIQTVDMLRDAVVCPSDLAVSGELSENPDQKFTQRAKDMYKSGFIYIEDVFYNDFRDPSNIDYSRVIRNWAKTRGLGPFKTGWMEKTRFKDLKMKLGYPYVYQHQGKCEHLLVFSDVRLLHPSDRLSTKNYPSLHSLSSSNAQYCVICGIYSARWITFENEQVPHDPCFFCDCCFRSYNYIDGKKVGKFKAYPFFGKP